MDKFKVGDRVIPDKPDTPLLSDKRFTPFLYKAAIVHHLSEGGTYVYLSEDDIAPFKHSELSACPKKSIIICLNQTEG